MAGDLHPSSTHPPLPPTTEDIRTIHLRLLRSRRVGPSTYHRLLREHGSAIAALEALPKIATDAGVKDYRICPEGVVQAELRAGRKAGATMLLYGHDGYPPQLMDLEQAPPVLWCLGNTDLLTRPILAFVGARNASALGTRMATSLARDVSDAGYVVASGLARGIDAAAHQASLDGGTIAVQAGGVDVIYPAENTELAHQISKKGLRLSEQPMGCQPMARHFPARNRIIAGLAQACILVEAATRSGSLITARDTLDLGRDVLAVPGHPFDARSSGCNALIRDGAALIRGSNDILEALPPLAAHGLEKLRGGDAVDTPLSQMNTVSPGTLSPEQAERMHSLILDRLGPNPVPLDVLLRQLPKIEGDVTPLLSEMELKGRIKRHAGGRLSRCA